MTKPKKKKDKGGGEDGEASSSRKRLRSEGSTASQKTKRPKRGDPGYDPYDFTSSEEEEGGDEGEEEAEDTPTSQSHDQGGGGESMDTESAQSAPVVMDAERCGHKVVF